ncbi:MAG: helix-turn-helix transcriptional regulator [bacterium]
MSVPAHVGIESAAQQFNTSATDPDKLLTTDEAAAYLRVSPRTMEDWRRTGSGPLYIPLARNCVRYRFGDLTQWIIRRRVRHTLQPTA